MDYVMKIVENKEYIQTADEECHAPDRGVLRLYLVCSDAYGATC